VLPILGLGTFAGVSAPIFMKSWASTPLSASSRLIPDCCFTLLHPTFKPSPKKRSGEVLGISLQVESKVIGCDNWAK
jgi:hypothetical protein